MNPCPICLFPRATFGDQVLRHAATVSSLPAGWADPEGSHLCWKEWGGVCEPPEWWASVTPLDVQVLRAERDELRLTLAAELGQPKVGADLGFTLEPEGWVKPLGTPNEFGETNEAIVIEDYRNFDHPTGRPYR